MGKKIMKLSGNIVDVLNFTIYPGVLRISDGKIIEVVKENKKYKNYIIPGFIDSHIHIESSMLLPSEFARIALIHGTVGAVCDPHEIANILGIKGVKYMIKNGQRSPLKFYFGVPSCVPATPFETNGAVLDSAKVEKLLKIKGIKHLAEVMNYPAVINKDPTIMKKIHLAWKYNKQVDGHAPGLSGRKLKKYIEAGIHTDHETVTKKEALEKLRLGMKIQIREGSAVKNFDALVSIISKHYKNCMFCSDDKHPDDLIRGHINTLVKKAVKYGLHPMKVLTVACVNPVLHYGLDIGLLQKGDDADFLLINNLKDFKVLKTFVRGEIVAKNGKTLIKKIKPKIINNFKIEEKSIKDFIFPYKLKAYTKRENIQQKPFKNKRLNKFGRSKLTVIEVIDGQLITNRLLVKPKVQDGYLISDVKRDILKITVVNRYKEAPPAIAFVKNFGLKKGAIASSISHDSHNIIAVGVADEDITKAVNLIIRNKGGISVASDNLQKILPLPIAGIMSDESYFSVAKKYIQLTKISKSFGCRLQAPFMTLSFMALLVIPKIKLGDRGLFNAEKFEFIDIYSIL